MTWQDQSYMFSNQTSKLGFVTESGLTTIHMLINNFLILTVSIFGLVVFLRSTITNLFTEKLAGRYDKDNWQLTENVVSAVYCVIVVLLLYRGSIKICKYRITGRYENKSRRYNSGNSIIINIIVVWLGIVIWYTYISVRKIDN